MEQTFLLPHLACDLSDALQGRIAYFCLSLLKTWISKQEQVKNVVRQRVAGVVERTGLDCVYRRIGKGSTGATNQSDGHVLVGWQFFEIWLQLVHKLLDFLVCSEIGTCSGKLGGERFGQLVK